MKEFLVLFEHIHVNNGRVLMDVRVGNYSIHVGDNMGGATVQRIQAYEKNLEETGAGLTCRLTLDKMPMFLVHEFTKGEQ